MKCLKCGRQNKPEDRFCVFCGSPLPLPEGKDTNSQPEVSEELKHLKEQLARMNDRLVSLESQKGKAVPRHLPEPVQAVQPLPQRETASVKAETAPAHRVKAVAEAKEREWEQILGGNWLARIGVVAIIIGIGFFLKYAFDNEWLGPEGQIILGIIAGLIMLYGSYRWRGKYIILAQALGGGGIAVLYLSIFASFAIYDLVNFYLAAALLLLVSILSIVLSVSYNSMALSIIGVFGAFVAPFILGAFGEGSPAGSQTGQSIQLLVYIILVDAGVLGLSIFRKWHWFILLALLLSLASFGGWYHQFGQEGEIAVSMIFITLIFLLFTAVTAPLYAARKGAPEEFDYILMAINVFFYSLISLSLMWDVFRDWMGGFICLLALFYGALTWLMFKKSKGKFPLFLVTIALFFVTLAIPVQFEDSVWTTLAWAAEGAVLIWLAITYKIPQIRNYGYLVFVLMFLRLLFFDTGVEISGFQPVINERFLAFTFAIAALLFAYLREKKAFLDKEAAAMYYPLLLLVVNFLFIWLLSFEAWNYFDRQLLENGLGDAGARIALQNAQNLSLTCLWAVYAVVALVIGIIRRLYYVRAWALALLMLVVAKVFLYDVTQLDTAYRIVSFTSLGLLLLISAYLYQRHSKAIKGFFKSNAG